jgi:hypothetical protein
MKTLFIIILGFFFPILNKYDENEGEINITAKVEKIDSLKSCYLIYIKSSKSEGMFIKPKFCIKKTDFKNKLKVGRSYLFTLKKDTYTSGRLPAKEYKEELVDGRVIWTSKMKIAFYEDCLNMCGLNIDNEGK